MEKRTMKQLTLLCTLTLTSILSIGCATNRGIIDVRVPPATINPSSGTLVAITKVIDMREFQETPSEPSIPSLKGGEINDETITSRAIARKRNGYGKALGDILLPEGRTVEDLVRETAEKSLAEKGYVVVKDRSQYADALPVEIEIHQFWAWMIPGFWTLELDFEAIITASNETVFMSPGEKIRGHVALKTQAAGTGAWTNTINKGLEDLCEQIKSDIKTP